eukprot:TRINITY_DN431_c0_g1_i3.p1 TRINITY_DN431_c0_g1~~TRINITY_DN431_c0_g1_i3.p1  ORF type:complete len:170 (-),score=59.02 TRINITY_DN431_c0_g1_i3:167-676(-)
MAMFSNVMKNLKMRDGKVKLKNFVKLFVKVGCDSTAAEHFFNAMDTDGSGTVDEDELLESYGVQFGGSVEQRLRQSFRIFDHNRSNSLDKGEVKRGYAELIRAKTRMAHHLTGKTTVIFTPEQIKQLEDKIDDIYAKVDTNGDGVLNIDEYLDGFKNYPELCEGFQQFT